MILLARLFPKKREYLCFVWNSKKIKFKGKTWKNKYSLTFDAFEAESNGVKFYLRVMSNHIRLEANEARGYDDKYIESFKSSFFNSISKRPKRCEDCMYKFKYAVSGICEEKYKLIKKSGE